MPVRVGYYEAARRTTWECSCGWHGRFEEMVQGLSSELIEASCPARDAHLALIDLPTIEDTRRAADAGSDEAERDLPRAEATEGRWQRAAALQLTRADQLPHLDLPAPDPVCLGPGSRRRR